MNKNIYKNNSFLLAIFAMIIVSFIAINIASSLALGSVKFDLTEDKKYTFSDKTENWLKGNNNTIFVKLFISSDLEKNNPQLGQYSKYVMRFLEKYKLKGNYKLNLSIENVEPYSQREKEAKDYGLQGFLDNSGKYNLYFGAVFSNYDGKAYSIDYFEPKRQSYLEQDVTRVLSKLSGYEPKNISVLSPLVDVMNKNEMFDTAVDWSFITQLRNDYNVEYLDPIVFQIPFSTDVLIVVNPQGLEELTLYAVDQYLMRGGNILIFNDPFSEVLLNTHGFSGGESENIMSFYKNLGILYKDDIMVGDNENNQSTIVKAEDSDAKLQNYPIWLELDEKHINQNNLITKDLLNLRFNSAGYFEVDENKSPLLTASMTPLFNTSTKAGVLDINIARYGTQSDIIDAFEVNDNKSYNLGYLLEGNFPSYYYDNIVGDEDVRKKMLPFLIASIKSGKLLLVGDSDFLYHTNWNKGDNTKSMYSFIPYTSNMDFVQKSVDYLSGNNDLVYVTPKYRMNAFDTINARLKQYVYEEFGETYQKLNYNINIAKKENFILLNKINNKQIASSVAIIKRLELLQRQMITNKNKLEKLEYEMQEKQKFYRNLIIFSNAVLFPLLLIILFGFINFIFQKNNKKNALRYINE